MTHLLALTEETWGERFRRARERAGLTLRDAETRLRPAIETSYKTLNRLERAATVPTGRREHLAYLALLSYGYDPADFGLGESATARIVDCEAVLRLLNPEDVRETVGGLVRSTLRKPRCSAAKRYRHNRFCRTGCALVSSST